MVLDENEMADVGVDERQLEITLTTKLPEEFHVDTPGAIVVPQRLGRYGLSELVNHMLERDEPMPFDFLINGEFLRSTLAQYMKFNNVTAETVLDVEYCLAMPSPETDEVDTNEDWLASISTLPASSSDEVSVATASFDGVLRFYAGEPLARVAQHKIADLPIKSMHALRHNNIIVVGLGLKDGRVMLNAYSVADPTKCIFSSESDAGAHKGSVDAVQLSPDGSFLASGGTDNVVLVWNSENAMNATGEKSKKRKIQELSQRHKLDEHKDAISSLKWADNLTLMSGAVDMHVKVWDVASGAQAVSLPVAKAVCDFDYMPAKFGMDAQIVTGHADGRTHVWKVKNAEKSWADAKIEVVQTFAPFTRIVPAVKFTNLEDKTASAVAFVAGSQDGQLKVFDARAKVARAACSAEEGVRLLCLNWLKKNLKNISGI